MSSINTQLMIIYAMRFHFLPGTIALIPVDDVFLLSTLVYLLVRLVELLFDDMLLLLVSGIL